MRDRHIIYTYNTYISIHTTPTYIYIQHLHYLYMQHLSSMYVCTEQQYIYWLHMKNDDGCDDDIDDNDDDDARTECTLPMHSLYKTAVQCATLEDLIFMQGKHPKIRSMIISVYSFTLLGNLVDTCEVVDYKPFLSYVREDDDYYSLCRRLTEISGEADVEKFRLAVVFDKVPYFIPKPAAAVLHTIGDGSGTINNHHHQDISISSVWSHFVDKYPSFVAKKDSSIVGGNNNLRVHGNFPITTGKSKFGNHTRIFPQLGIQRSVSDLHSKLRYKM